MSEQLQKDYPSYYSILTAEVRYDKRLSANEKLLYSEITALCNKNGTCWASNSYFAELYDVTTVSVSKWVNHLKEVGYIDVKMQYREGSNEIEKRIITLTGVKENFNTSIKENLNTGIKENFKDNTTSINTTSNNSIIGLRPITDNSSTDTLKSFDINKDNGQWVWDDDINWDYGKE